MLGISGKVLPLTGGSDSLISPSRAPLPAVVFHSRPTSKLKTPSLRVYIASVYWFHLYYTTRHILEKLHISLPEDKSYSWCQNGYDTRAYKRLCSEFGVSTDTNWRQKLDHGCHCLGSWSTYMTPSHEYRHAHQAWHGTFFHPMDAIRHKRDISAAWATFVLDNSDSFTQAGITRLNDSIRTYVWAVLGSQAQTHSNILERDLTPQNNSWRMLKTRFPRP